MQKTVSEVLKSWYFFLHFGRQANGGGYGPASLPPGCATEFEWVAIFCKISDKKLLFDRSAFAKKVFKVCEAEIRSKTMYNNDLFLQKNLLLPRASPLDHFAVTK